MRYWFNPGDEAVYGFKNDGPATFDTFSTPVPGTGDNVKEIELLYGNESASGKFTSLGTFTTQNAKLMKTPYQEFHFAPVTAKYLKVRLVSSWSGKGMELYEFRLMGVAK